MRIKAIIFDTGGILIDEIGKEAREKMAEKFNFPSKIFSEIFTKYQNFSYTGWHYNAFFQKVVDELNLKFSYKELANEWLKIRKETSSINEEVKNLIIKLNKDFIIGMLTNSTILNEKASARKNILNLFNKDLSIFSFEVGFMKPEEEIYKILIEKLKAKEIKPEETIFIDDKEENLFPAKKLGVKTILFKNANQLKKELNNLGVKT